MSPETSRDLELDFTTELTAIPPFSFELTVHKPAGWDWLTPFEIFEDGTIWTGTRMGSNPIGLKLHSEGDIDTPRIALEAYSQSPFSPEARRLLQSRVERFLAADVDIREFYGLAEDHSVLSRAVENLYGMRWGNGDSVFSEALLAIALQMAPVKRSLEMHRCLYKNYGETLQFDDQETIIHPDPQTIDTVSESDLRTLCKLGYRASYIKSVAHDVASDRAPRMEDLEKMTAEEARTELLKLKGIGDYSAGIIGPHPSFPLDVWSVKIFAEVFGIELGEKPRESIPNVKKYAEERFGRWRHYVFLYVLHDLDNLELDAG